MQEKYLIIPRKKELDEYTKYGFNSFILPLEDYSISFDVYFSLEEINTLADKYTIYVIMNKFIHKTVSEFKKIYDLFNPNIKFIVEDIGFTSIIDKDRFVLFENHIESNYKAINFLNSIGINSVMINNDLTINEIIDIRKNTNLKLYYLLVNRNILLYSKRHLVSNYNEHYNLDNTDRYTLIEDVSKKELNIYEEKDGTSIYNYKLFAGNKYIKELEKLDYLIINTTSMSDLEFNVVMENYNKEELINIIDADYYFLENGIEYKVGGKK